MKSFLLLAATVLTTSSAFAQLAPSIPSPGHRSTACSCYELERRTYGLQYVLDYGRLNNSERREISRAVDIGNRTLLAADRERSEHRQEFTCSRGNQQVNRPWVRWQPWVSQSGADIGNPCE